jgi:hypothetical protein
MVTIQSLSKQYTGKTDKACPRKREREGNQREKDERKMKVFQRECNRKQTGEKK